ncbi:MAG: cysteine desulfurase family protein [Bacteroidota bacterium]|nr:cysteine desulfurase family protein [Bacteroidota bacterium]
MKVYFDHAATSPIHPDVAELMYQVIKEDFGNPSSSHSFGRKAKSHLELSRKKIAQLLNVSPSEIVFTSGGTEADNLILRSGVIDLGIKTIITSPIEHHAVLHTVEDLNQKYGTQVLYVNLLENGHVDLKHLEELLQNHSNVLVSLMHANNEIGNIIDLKLIGDLCLKYNALFHSDTVQTMGNYALDFNYETSGINIDFAVGAAHKFNGPKGVGFMFYKKKNKLKPCITGGGQERELRAGTENIYGIAAMAKALEICYAEMEKKQAHLKELKSYFIQRIENELPEIKFNGDYKGNSSYTVLSLALPPRVVSEMLLFNFDLHGIAISGGSACSSGSNKGSHVIRAIKQNLDCAPIRFSFGKTSTKEEVDFAINFMKTLF